MRESTVVIVGASGTVGLELARRLSARDDIAVRELTGRADKDHLAQALAGADVAVLCLPEMAARDFAAAAPETLRILDASSAHRLAPGWTYGLPELDGDQALRIRTATRVANPGCFATGAILLLRPLLAERPAEKHLQVAITGVGGASSGGRKMIEEAAGGRLGYRLYGLDQDHRHIPEIQRYSQLASTPIFMPGVAGHHCGTLVQIPFTRAHLQLSYEQIVDRLQRAYVDTPRVRVEAVTPGARYLDASALAGDEGVVLQVHTDSSRSRFVLTAHFDNLGIGAAGSAERNLELMLGLR